MANERQKTQEEGGLPKLAYDWYLLGNAKVAEAYLNQGEEGVPFTQKGLELILSDARVVDPWIVKTVTDPEVLHKTIANQMETYSQYRGIQTIGDLTQRYSADFTKYLGEDGAEAAFNELKAFEEEKYSAVQDKIARLKDVIVGKKFGRSSDEDVEKAKKTLAVYQKVMTTFDLLEGLYRGRFRTRVEEEVTKDALKALYKPKEKEKK